MSAERRLKDEQYKLGFAVIFLQAPFLFQSCSDHCYIVGGGLAASSQDTDTFV